MEDIGSQIALAIVGILEKLTYKLAVRVKKQIIKELGKENDKKKPTSSDKK